MHFGLSLVLFSPGLWGTLVNKFSGGVGYRFVLMSFFAQCRGVIRARVYIGVREHVGFGDIIRGSIEDAATRLLI